MGGPRLPIALQSLLIQCLALAPVAALAVLWPLPGQAAPWQLVSAQGLVAAALSRAWQQPPWWWPLHLGFLPLAWLAAQAAVPSWIYLAAFLMLLLVYWTTFRTRVPLYLSDRKAWHALASLLPEGRRFRFIDLGSGLGGVPLYLEARLPDGEFHGAEIAPAPWLASRLRAWLRRSGVMFQRRDYRTLDLGGFDVVFAFLSPAAMPALWRQARAQMRPGSVLVSLSFPVPGQPPDRVVRLGGAARHTLYAWQM